MSESNYKPEFHPFEVGLCGFSNSGKTVLSQKLIHSMSRKYSIGYIKHDTHFFQMDKEGKDTDVCYKAGAESVYISDKTHQALIQRGNSDFILKKTMFSNYDFVLVEGHKKQAHRKIVVLDSAGEIQKLVLKSEISNIIGFVGEAESLPEGLPKLPYFHRDDVVQIAKFIEQRVLKPILPRKLKALVLAGGKSTRMNEDKTILNYHGKTQLEHTYELLSEHVDEVFVSSREGQWGTRFDHLPQIYDQLLNSGPIGGILSAQLKYPDSSFLVVACDLPFINNEVIEDLLVQRNPFKYATAYESENDQLPEPLCAIYEPKSKMRMFEFFGLGYRCPRKVLIQSPIQLLKLKTKNALDNINYPEERLAANKVLGRTL